MVFLPVVLDCLFVSAWYTKNLTHDLEGFELTSVLGVDYPGQNSDNPYVEFIGFAKSVVVPFGKLLFRWLWLGSNFEPN